MAGSLVSSALSLALFEAGAFRFDGGAERVDVGFVRVEERVARVADASVETAEVETGLRRGGMVVVRVKESSVTRLQCVSIVEACAGAASQSLDVPLGKRRPEATRFGLACFALLPQKHSGRPSFLSSFPSFFPSFTSVSGTTNHGHF